MVQAFGGDQKRKVRLVFQDEAGFGRISDLRNRWAPEKMRPDVKKQIVREKYFGNKPCDSFDEVEKRLCKALKEIGRQQIFGQRDDRFPKEVTILTLRFSALH